MAHRMETLLGHLTSSRTMTANNCGSGLRYSVDDGILTAEERLSYEQDGFIVVKGLVSLEDLQAYKERFRDICAGKVKVSIIISSYTVIISHARWVPGMYVCIQCTIFILTVVYFCKFHIFQCFA